MAAPSSVPPPHPAAAGAYASAVVLRLLGTLEENAAAFAAGREVEPLHQLRVSARRLRAVLSFFAPLFHADDDVEAARRRIRKLALPFGELRDLDVFLEHLDDGAAPVAPADVAPLRHALARRRTHLAADVAAEVGSRRWRRALGRVRTGLDGGSWRDSPAAVVDARTFASERLDLWWWAFLAGSEGLAALPPTARHRVRIEAKKLRYATEATADLFEAQTAEAFTDTIKDIQDALGVLNDHAVAERIVRDAGFRPVRVRETGDDIDRALAARAGLVARGPYW